MKRKFKTVILVTAICCILISSVIAFATAGDDNDPLVTLSYITDVLLPDIDSRINTKVESIKSQSSAEGASFVLVEVQKGYKIIGEEGTELVLRAGMGSIIATAQGGVADLTSGSDLPDGTEIPLNHHLLVPRNDSRGMSFTENALVMVKGGYKITKK